MTIFTVARIPDSDRKPLQWWVLANGKPIHQSMTRTQTEAEQIAARSRVDAEYRAELLEGKVSAEAMR
jgi:hypothetical protein